MKATAIVMVGLLVVAGGLSVQKAASSSVRNGQTFNGEIMDSFCAEDGRHIGVKTSSKNTSKVGCTNACVKLSGAKYVLYNAKNGYIYKLDDQRQPESFAGQQVTVTGDYDNEAKTIHVTSIRPQIIYANSVKP